MCQVASIISNSLELHGASCPTRAHRLRGSAGKNTRVGCHALLQGTLLTQGLNWCLMSPALAGRFSITGATWEGPKFAHIVNIGSTTTKMYEL